MKTIGTILKKSWKLTVLFVLFLLVFSYAMFEGGFVSWFLFYSFLPFVLYALSLFFYPLKDFQVERVIQPGPYFAGESVTIELQLKRTFPFPLLYVWAEERMERRLQERAILHGKAIVPLFRRNVTYEIVAENVQRGQHLFTGTYVKTSDMFGFIEKEALLSQENSLLVYPARLKLSFPSTVRNTEGGARSAPTQQKQRETTMATGVRNYERGDRLSWINWRATAKRSDMMTKEFEQEEEEETIVILDRSPHASFELLVSFAASLLYTNFKKGKKTGFLSSGSDRVYFPQGEGKEQYKQTLTHLAFVEANSPNSLNEIIKKERILQSARMNVALVVGELSQSLIQTLAMYTSRNREVLVYYVLDKTATLTNAEKVLITIGKERRVQIRIVREGKTEAEFIEVFS